MNFTPKTYKKSHKRLMFRIRVGLWLIKRGHGNRARLEPYIRRNSVAGQRVINRFIREYTA